MSYPPEFTTNLHTDIEYLYKIYAGYMMHRDDKKAIHITVTPIKREFESGEVQKQYRIDLLKPNHPDELDLDQAILK
jgi:hypothetical protein